MVYDKKLADRIKKILQKCKGVAEKEMFGGKSFLINGKMCCGVIKNDLVIRVNPKDYEKLLNRQNVRPMDFTGKPIKGFIYVNSKGCKSSVALSNWVKLGVDYVTSLREENKKTITT